MQTTEKAATAGRLESPGGPAAKAGAGERARRRRKPETPVDRGGALPPSEAPAAADECVEVASAESFPASDPPAWMQIHVR